MEWILTFLLGPRVAEITIAGRTPREASAWDDELAEALVHFQYQAIRRDTAIMRWVGVGAASCIAIAPAVVGLTQSAPVGWYVLLLGGLSAIALFLWQARGRIVWPLPPYQRDRSEVHPTWDDVHRFNKPREQAQRALDRFISGGASLLTTWALTCVTALWSGRLGWSDFTEHILVTVSWGIGVVVAFRLGTAVFKRVFGIP